ncbi:cyclin-like protein [Myriangium duriaei CBS 260.36]|uniref:RNA polymerase II holoenzyme cyclin-like subunit n=1 Tax=Myriangium duriaei CBS 260.36 TaxID=1168546 RepID=A0A9P4IWU2_9PEZI|nr:cyclin-like protein [Myriangium duriaei CBS 260.36]
MARAKSPNRVLAEAEEQWIFDEEELTRTPSIQDGMSIEKEKELRAKGINFIRQVGIMLKLPELTLSTGAIFFNRYLMRHSLVDKPGIKALHHYTLGATCLFLATKVEESCRKMKDIVIACCRVAQKNPNLVIDEQSKDFWKWRDTILFNEDVLLETVVFDLTIEAPHKQLFEMLKYYRVEHNKQLRNAAWAFVTDSNMTQLCLLCNSRTIAAAALYAGARFYDVQLPDTHNRPWWSEQGVRLKDMVKAANYMCQNYEAPPQKGDGTGTGGQSIYVGLFTEFGGSSPADQEGEELPWEKTRLRNEQAIGSPLVAGQIEDRSRRGSLGSQSSKRGRDTSPGNQNASKRRRISPEKSLANGDPAKSNGKNLRDVEVQEKEDASEEGEVEE